METSLGCGYSIHEEFPLTDFYSPPSSVIDEIDEHEDDLSYHEEEGHDEENSIVQSQDPTLPSSLIEEINNINLNTLKTPSGTTPPPTPLVSHRSIVPPNSASSNAFPSMTIDHSLTVSPAKPTDRSMNTWSFEALSNTEMRNGNSLFSRPLEQIPKTNSSQLLGPTTLDRYLAEQSRLPDSMSRSSTTLEHSLSIGSSLNQRPTSLSGSNAEIPQEISRLYSYLSPTVEVSSPNRLSSNTSWSTSDEDSTYPFQSRITSTNPFASSSQFKATSWLPNANPFVPKSNPPASPYQQVTSPTTPSMRNPYSNANANPSHWLLSEMSAMLRQNQLQQPSMITLNNNITLSTTAQQILASNMNNHGNNNNNNRPLRSEKIDIEIIKHLIQEAKWKRQCGLKKEVCVFCRNNGENELIYSSHSLKDSLGNVTCPILRAYQCPICGATGAQAHTIKYCQATGDENNQHIPTPYEKMMRTQCMQSFPFDENFTSTYPTLFDPLAASPSSLYTNGWSNSYL